MTEEQYDKPQERQREDARTVAVGGPVLLTRRPPPTIVPPSARLSRYGEETMRRNSWWLVSVALVLAFVLGFAVARFDLREATAGRASVALDQHSTDIERIETILKKLAEMNRLLHDALEDYHARRIDESGVRGVLDMVAQDKGFILGTFPRVFGEPYFFWYEDLESIDRAISNAYAQTVGPAGQVNATNVARALLDVERGKKSLEQRLMKKLQELRR
jgi:hypothetical protein